MDREPSTGARTSAWAHDFVCHRVSPWPVGQGLQRPTATYCGRVVVTEWIDNDKSSHAETRAFVCRAIDARTSASVGDPREVFAGCTRKRLRQRDPTVKALWSSHFCFGVLGRG